MRTFEGNHCIATYHGTPACKLCPETRNYTAWLATNLHGLGVTPKVIQQILRHADITTTMNIYVKSDMGEATAAAMNALEAMCATNVQPFTGEASPVM